MQTSFRATDISWNVTRYFEYLYVHTSTIFRDFTQGDTDAATYGHDVVNCARVTQKPSLLFSNLQYY